MTLAKSMPGVVATIALASAFCAVVLGFVVGLVVWGDHSFEYYGTDPASTFGASQFVGLLSHAGVLLAWGAGFASVVAGAFVARARGWRHALPLLVAGAGTAYLAFDDLFRLHEEILPRLRIEEEAIFGVYVVATLAFLWWYRRFFREHEWPLLALAAVALAASVALDQKIVNPSAALSRWLEDGLKLFGLAFLALYLVRLSVCMLGDAYPPDRPHRHNAPRKIRATAPLGVVTTAVLVAALCVLLLGTVAILVAAGEHPFKYYSKDPASTLSASPLVGLLSHAGVLLAWGAGFASVLVGAFLARDRGWRQASPLLVAGAATAYLALDDLFLLHESLYPRSGIGEDAFLIAYVVAALAFLWWYRRVFREHEWPLLALALVVLGGSFALDLADLVDGSLSWLGDCLKLFGIALFAAYLLRLGAVMVADAYPVLASDQLEAGADAATESNGGVATDSGPKPAVTPQG